MGAISYFPYRESPMSPSPRDAPPVGFFPTWPAHVARYSKSVIISEVPSRRLVIQAWLWTLGLLVAMCAAGESQGTVPEVRPRMDPFLIDEPAVSTVAEWISSLPVQDANGRVGGQGKGIP